MSDDLVIASIQADLSIRSDFGRKKYGVTVGDSPLELAAWLQHAYEEALDMAVYLKRAMLELEKP